VPTVTVKEAATRASTMGRPTLPAAWVSGVRRVSSSVLELQVLEQINFAQDKHFLDLSHSDAMNIKGRAIRVARTCRRWEEGTLKMLMSLWHAAESVIYSSSCETCVTIFSCCRSDHRNTARYVVKCIL
jgi:hypothetical protein